MTLKVSDYNLVWPIKDNKSLLIYNSFTTKLATIDINNGYLLKKDLFEMSSLTDEEKAIIKDMMKNGFIIDSSIDELKVLKFSSQKYKYDKSSLSLTIVPTHSCNFRCTYCFEEEKKSPPMSDAVQKSIIGYIEKTVKKLDRIIITWFGGEPLLAANIVQDMSHRITKIAAKNDCECSFLIVTNGYLLNSAMIADLKELNIAGIQITLDGPPHIHNTRRVLKGKKQDNFDEILSNIKELIDNKMKVNIRVNIDKTNAESVEELLEKLTDAGIKENSISFAQTYSYTDTCMSVEETIMTVEEFSRIELKLNELLVSKGFINDFSHILPKRKSNYCCADHINSFVIDPEGNMYKCDSDFGDKKSSVDNVVTLKSTKLEKMKHVRWITWSPFDYEECINCKILPLCMGGCPYLGMKEGKPHCPSTKLNIEAIIKKHYSYMTN